MAHFMSCMELMHAGPAQMMAHEVQKMIAQDRVLPGALADAVQLSLASGVAGQALQLPVLEVAGAIDDRRILHGEPSLKQPITAGCAANPRAAASCRGPPSLATPTLRRSSSSGCCVGR